ncbi:MAG TPA: phosphatase PAP2 family protein [Gemmatimonadaceae bacterium]
MMRVYSTRSLLLGALLVAGQRAGAQSVGRMVGYDVAHAFGDVVGTWLAPFHSSGREWLDAGFVVLGAAAISPWDDNIDNWFVRNHDSNVWSAFGAFREGGAAFSGKTITPVAAGLYVVGLVTKSQGIRDGVWGCVASYVAESVVRSQVMFRLIGRERPDSVRGEHELTESKQGDQYKFSFPGDGWGRHSLPAGHVANVMACGSFLSHRFDNPYLTIPAYTIAFGVGVGRMVDGRHWNSDTILGAIFGYAVGKEVALRSVERRQRDDAGKPATGNRGLFLGGDGQAVVIGWKTTF